MATNLVSDLSTSVLPSSEASSAGVAQTSSVPSGREGDASGMIDVNLRMMGLTWLTFGITAALLYKIAWKPILRALELREEGIKRALEEAEKARAEKAEIAERAAKVMQETEARSEQILAAARSSAHELGQTLERQARENAERLTEEARREIGAEAERARVRLRQEAAGLAIDLAGRLTAEHMDTEKNRRLVREMTAGAG